MNTESEGNKMKTWWIIAIIGIMILIVCEIMGIPID